MPNAISSYYRPSVSQPKAEESAPQPPRITELSKCDLGLSLTSVVVVDIVLRAEWQSLQFERAPHVQRVVDCNAFSNSIGIFSLYKAAAAYLQQSQTHPPTFHKAPFAPTLEHVWTIDSAIQQAEDDSNLLIIWKKIVRIAIFQGRVVPEHLFKPGIEDVKEIKFWFTRNFVFLSTIKSLDLSHLGLTSIPLELNYLRNLTKLNLSHNRITRLGSQFGLEWENLVMLDLSYNLLTHVTIAFGGHWPFLQKLSLSGNKLAKLPNHFGLGWENIETIFLHDNLLTSLPTRFGASWSKLRILCLSRNRLSAFPFRMGKPWKDLQILIVQDNLITDLHPHFGLKWSWWLRRRELVLKGNPILQSRL